MSVPIDFKANTDGSASASAAAGRESTSQSSAGAGGAPTGNASSGAGGVVGGGASTPSGTAGAAGGSERGGQAGSASRQGGASGRGAVAGTSGRGGAGGAAGQSTAPTFSDIYKNILSVYCGGSTCHYPGSQHGVGFSTQSGAYKSLVSVAVIPGNAQGSTLYTLVATGVMPDGGPMLSNEFIDEIAAWIDAGALNN